MSEHGFGSVPELVSWHLPICLYQPDQNRIYYSDLDGLPEEVAPFHADLLAAQPEPTVDLLRDAMPFLIAHELTHAFRDQLGLLSGDAWLEEAIANEVAYAYVARHAEDTASAVLRLAERIVDRNGEGSRRPEEPCPTDADGRKQGVATDQNAEGGDYDCTPRQAAVRHAHMILAISSRKPRLEDALVTWFQPDEPLAAE
jgi:hypothetical protein